ncbi:serine/threonine-protein kinase pim-2-like [Centroberyx affinis]|uniref:serine/threonine-protein kinase pim-2-like n=1 Tax=Centroberyx affinis TaxID=166261 RepID=UPI003A5C4FAD
MFSRPAQSLPAFTCRRDLGNHASVAGAKRHTEPCNLQTEDARKRRNKRKAGTEESREGTKKKRRSTQSPSAQLGQRVAIKHIPREKVFRTNVIKNGKVCELPLEVVLLLKLAPAPGSIGQTAAIALMDWYDLEQELILVLERPSPCMDLRKYLEDSGGVLEEHEAKIILRQLVAAFIEIHAKGVLHRDVKLENILVETGCDIHRFRVIDFGCGCTLEEGPYTTCCGTRLYFPPEWYEHHSYMAGPFTVWQLGVVLFTLLNGHLPFYTRTHILQCNPATNDWLSQNCHDLLQWCLAKCPEDRPTLEDLLLHPWLE